MKLITIILLACAAFLAVAQHDRDWPTELIPVEKIKYVRNKTSFCIRPPEMIDTIVLHHSETPNTATPEFINQLHLNRGTPQDPWYMVGYSYQLNAPYGNETNVRPRITEGRPLDIVGAHAGSAAFVEMDEEQSRMWKEGKIVCGKEGGPFKVDPAQLSNGKIKANVTTIGLVVIGNYAPFSRENPNGYSSQNPRSPTGNTIDMIARMSCQLQLKYPRIKNIKWHNYYHATTCPGNIKDHIGKIKLKAKEYGCEFI